MLLGLKESEKRFAQIVERCPFHSKLPHYIKIPNKRIITLQNALVNNYLYKGGFITPHPLPSQWGENKKALCYAEEKKHCEV